MPVSHTNVDFVNRIGETEDFNVLEYGYLYNGGGVAAGDFNNDGLIDLYFTGNMVGSHLYINKGNLEFDERAKESGVFAEGLWNTGVALVDINLDGYLDIYVCRSAAKVPSKRENLLFINNGDLTFSEQAKQYGIADSGYSTHASFFDYDNDGDLDLYVLNHSTQEYAGFSQITPMLKNKFDTDFADKLYRNDGNVFTEVGKQAGLVSNVLGFGLGLAISDINNDGWLDIYVSNDYNEQDYLYINQKNGTFLEDLSSYIGHTSLFSMGSDAADVNNDGYTDILTLDMLPEDNYRQKMVSGPDNYEKFSKLAGAGFYHQTMRNMLQLNNQGESFSEIGQFAGISNTDWSWAPLIADFDNDGLKDIYITNGYKRDYTNMDFINYAVQLKLQEDKTGVKSSIMSLLDKMPSTVIPNYTFHNLGDGRFEKVSNSWGLGQKSLSNGAVYTDLDNDGDLDIVVNNMDSHAFVYRNNTIKGNSGDYVQVSLKGPKKNPMGVGAKVEVVSSSVRQVQEYMPSRGYQSSMAGPLHFGLPKNDSIVYVNVLWPGGFGQRIENVRSGSLHTFNYEDAVPLHTETEKNIPMFLKITGDSLSNYVHGPNNFNDFRNERLLPHKLSTQGPRMAKADVNTDGLMDIFVPGGKGSVSALFEQGPSGSFKRTNTGVFDKTKEIEIVNAHFFDADSDGDEDLYLVTGGNEFPAGSDAYLDQLYINDGKGNFVPSETNALPGNVQSGLAIASADLDQDGDLDLFVAGRVIPGKYPSAPNSYLYENMGDGTFQDVTHKWAPQLSTIGMVTDAAFADMNEDGYPDLWLVGEWMPLEYFRNEKGILAHQPIDAPVDKDAGWWNTIELVDYDDDGDTDIVLGNHGLNSQLKATRNEPVSLYYADFDDNGSLDPILTSFIFGKEYPVYSKDDMADQLVGLKGKYVNYADYATQTITDVFTKDELQTARKLEVAEFAHVLLENRSNGNFLQQELPNEAQWAPIHDILVADLNEDGHKDMLLVGNFFGTRVKFGRYDANRGLVYLGDGNGKWTYAKSSESGIHLKGENRSISMVRDSPNKKVIVMSQTVGPLIIYHSNPKYQRQ